MSRFVTTASGQRVWIDDDPAPAVEVEPAPSSGPPMTQRGWVDAFLSGPTGSRPLSFTTRTHRRAGRKSRRRI